MKVKDIMSSPAITCWIDSKLSDAVRIMAKHRIGVLPIIDHHGVLQGVLSENDFVPSYVEVPRGFTQRVLLNESIEVEQAEAILREAASEPVGKFMRKDASLISQEESLSFALIKMLKDKRFKLVVMNGAKPVGILSSHDIMKTVIQQEVAYSSHKYDFNPRHLIISGASLHHRKFY